MTRPCDVHWILDFFASDGGPPVAAFRITTARGMTCAAGDEVKNAMDAPCLRACRPWPPMSFACRMILYET